MEEAGLNTTQSCTIAEEDASEGAAWLSPRCLVALVALIGLVSCTIDTCIIEAPSDDECCHVRDHLHSLRMLLLTLFQIANLVLLFGTILEDHFLVSAYVWYTLAFVVMGLVLTLLEFLGRVQREGVAKACLFYVPEVALLFTLFRCLPFVDKYGRGLSGDDFVVIPRCLY